MTKRLRKAPDFAGFDVVRLDAQGRLLDDGGTVVPPSSTIECLAERLNLRDATDLFVFVHGWQNSPQRARAAAQRLFGGVSRTYADRPRAYPELAEFRPYYLSIQWPSESSPFPHGYRRIRDRAHAMTTRGHAAHVLAHLLGYLDAIRTKPQTAPTLRTARGQYLHCVGHSFGCRFLAEAIDAAANPPEVTLGWPWASDHPFSVDSFTGFQMAAPPDIFSARFASLTGGRAPISGPVVMTVSPHDRALSRWHRVPEGVPGLGAVGATGARSIRLRPTDQPYALADFNRLTNIDAGWLFRHGSLSAGGAHSDIWYPESAHLLLSLADLSR
jgi:hypothetical protein